MQTIALILEYDGSEFFGWQRQGYQRTVQIELEAALSRVANHPIEVYCAGRTDKGVHASHQVVHFLTNTERKLSAWVLGTNTFLPADVKILNAYVVPPDFHARFSALARRYVYRILNRPIRPAIARQTLTWEHRPLDAIKMHHAAQILIGEQDFSSFRSSQCQSRTPMRRVDFVTVSRVGEMLTVDIQANAFLHHMVRNIVGCLIMVGSGEKEIGWLKTVLDAKDRTKAAPTAPPNGLTLVEVIYPNPLG